jgi:hypothetical protein
MALVPLCQLVRCMGLAVYVYTYVLFRAGGVRFLGQVCSDGCCVGVEVRSFKKNEILRETLDMNFEARGGGARCHLGCGQKTAGTSPDACDFGIRGAVEWSRFFCLPPACDTAKGAVSGGNVCGVFHCRCCHSCHANGRSAQPTLSFSTNTLNAGRNGCLVGSVRSM